MTSGAAVERGTAQRSSGDVATAGAGGSRRRSPLLRFARHYLVMVVLMYAGMLLLNPVYDLLAGGAGYRDPWTELPTLSALVMAVNMTVPMAVWMRRHGHGRAAVAEMAAAMLLPTAAAAVAAGTGALSEGAVMTVAHVAMFPAMLLAMLLRRSEYAA